MSELTLRSAGPHTTVQDEGRAGHAHLGVPPSGALDRPAYALANRLVGNPPGTATLETTFGGMSLSADRHVILAVTGPPAPVHVGTRAVGINAPIVLLRGQVLAIGRPPAGVRNYVAVAGGIDVAAVFGSRATDVLSGLGPPQLADGDRLPLGDGPTEPAWIDLAPTRSVPGVLSVRLHPGPRLAWFAPGTLQHLCAAQYEVSPHSNRVAVRLSGPALERADDVELHSEGVVTGAVEVPADGQPLVLLADHPTTGGYPVVAVVDPGDLALLAQARAGDAVRFRPAPDVPRTGGERGRGR